MSAIRFIRGLKHLKQYGAILVVGGDGTVNEVITGMLTRKDQKHIPIGFLPSGCCNYAAKSFEILSASDFMDAYDSGDLLPCDVCEILLDHESEEEL